MSAPLLAALEPALAARLPLLDPKHEGALRLFNGFTEGYPGLAIDLYGHTLVFHDYAESEYGDDAACDAALALLRERLPFVKTGLRKVRHAQTQQARNGERMFGEDAPLTRKVKEDGLWYAVRLDAQRDASLYLDTRPLRAWARANLKGKKVLNTFAYTGSLGVAAMGAGAARVMQTDLQKSLLTVAKDSFTLNGYPIVKRDFRAGDFFDVVGELKREEALFDCAFIDPPFFSVTPRGRVDLEKDLEKLLNRVRPLIGHGGALVAVNNALFVPGQEYYALLERLCTDGYMKIEALIDAPADFTGFPGTKHGTWPVAPAPFNHPTKMAVLRVTRKDGKTA
jgi:23S rRNA (cytosine1962-C5)-methyltransferase